MNKHTIQFILTLTGELEYTEKVKLVERIIDILQQDVKASGSDGRLVLSDLLYRLDSISAGPDWLVANPYTSNLRSRDPAYLNNLAISINQFFEQFPELLPISGTG